MTKIKIHGVIYADDVPEWADEIVQSMIDRGIITVASRVCREIKAAEDGIELDVNSYGGEVFGAQAISAALCDWAKAHQGKAITVTVGALAASAAANLLVSLPSCAKVIGHDETLVMYHSAYSLCIGGAGAMRDEAALIDRINGRVQRALKAKTRFSPTLVDSWFAEGRCGWIDGWEAWDAGLFQELANDPAGAMPEKASGDAADAKINQMAAFADSILSNIKQQAHVKQEEAVMADKVKKVLAEETPAVEPEKEKDPVPAPAEPAQEDEEEKDPVPAPAEPAQEDEEEKEPCGGDDGEKKENEELAALRREVAELKEIVSKLTAGLKVPQVDERPKQTFKEAVAELNAKNLHGSAYDKAYAELIRRF